MIFSTFGMGLPCADSNGNNSKYFIIVSLEVEKKMYRKGQCIFCFCQWSNILPVSYVQYQSQENAIGAVHRAY